MSQLPNNSNLFIAQTPEPTSYGQTYHKQNYETDGITNYLNVNNDNSGNYTGSLGGFNFATLNSTMTDVLPLCNISPNGLAIPDISSSNKAILSQNGLTLNSGTDNTNEILPTQITLNDTVNNLTNLITPQIVELSDNQGTSSNIQADAMGFMINDGTIYKTATFSSQSLQIKNWLTNNKILMTDNSITLNDYYNINTNVIDKTQIALSNNSNFDSVIISPDSVLVRNTNNSSHVSINNYSVGISNDSNSYSSGITQTKFYLANTNPSYVQNIQIQSYPDITITTTDGTNTSILSPSDLTFNGVSLKSTVNSNTLDISQNKSDISSNTTNITTLQIKQITPFNQYISAAIYADARPPLPPTTIISQQYAFTPSWYFKNTFASNNKINWYIGPDISMTVSQVFGLYMNMFNGLTTSNDNSPFIIIYTQPQSGDSTFYHSKRTYLFNQSITPTVNTRYFMFTNLSGTCPTPIHYGSTLINMQLTTVSGNNVGPFLPTELILAFSIGSNSASALNSVEFAINKFGIMTPTGTTEINFIPST